MAKEKGRQKRQYSQDEKSELVGKICDLYASQYATLDSCCDAVGITSRSFYLWVAENSEFSDRYKKAKSSQDDYYWEELIKPKAKTGLLRRIEGEKKVETKSEGTVKDGVFSLTKKIETTSEILPDVTMVIFALKGLYPDKFKDRKEVTGADGGPIETKTLVIEIPNDGD